MRSAITVSTAMFLLLAGLAAYAQDQGPGASRGTASNKNIAEEVADLERKVDDLTVLLRAIVKADAARAREIDAALDRITSQKSPNASGSPGLTPSAPGSVPQATPSPEQATKPPPEAPTSGTISGSVKDADGNPVKAYVYVENVPARMAQNKRDKMQQIDKQFSPRFLVIQKGTRVVFPNQDSIYHNVFSRSKGNEFDLGSFRRGDPQGGVVFSTPGMVDVYCEIHSNMHATIVVVPNAYLAQVNRSGSFQLVGVPPGQRKVIAIGPGLEPAEQTVMVDGRTPALATFRMKAAKPDPHHYDYTGSVGVAK